MREHLEFYLAEICEKVSFDPYNFRITRLAARKSEQEKFLGDKNMPVNTKTTFNNASLSGFELYSRWVPLLSVSVASKIALRSLDYHGITMTLAQSS